ncbi:restriction endonuclease subunit S [Nostoc parmelioides]|uniref:Restriction endonuclease subunit S n=1 Tax=Nostoc parmelioides FACHB-3921 TaxID=2692909 RepID=A0ABR8BMD0_9NOSO|nr:restriction endonuclease subunit S [Nostoc parmelioides FACHB-3921]
MTQTFVQLGSVAEFINGAAFKPEDWGESGLRIIRIQNLTDPSKPFNRTERTVSELVRVQPGDLLVSWSATLGVFEWGGADEALLNQHIFRVLPNEKIVNKRYLRHGLEVAILDMKKHLHGATMQHINRGEFLSTKLYLPPLEEQRRIAEILDCAEEIRSKRREAIAQLDSLTQAIFLEMFGNPIENKKGWLLSQLGKVAIVERGKFTPRPRNDPSYYGGKFPFIQTGDISSSSGRLTKWNQTLNEKGVAVSRSFPPGTVVIAIVGATLGMTAILEVEVYCPDSVVGIQVHPEKASAEYIEQVLRFWRPIFIAKAPETARANINLETLRPLKIPVPSIELQQEFAHRVEAVEKLKAAHRASLSELDALFASLQHRAFRGEL